MLPNSPGVKDIITSKRSFLWIVGFIIGTTLLGLLASLLDSVIHLKSLEINRDIVETRNMC